VPLAKTYTRQDCSLARALEQVGERWTMLVLRDAFYGVRRYGDFLAHLDIPRAVLSDRLKTLVDVGVLEKRRYQDAPPRDEYVLTERGRELWPVIYGLAQWGERHLSTAPRRLFSHAHCGEQLDATGACPQCERKVPPEDIDVQPGPGADPDMRQDPVSQALQHKRRLLTPLP
jgi:DNA-binding HxlR family transcriptional regulator